MSINIELELSLYCGTEWYDVIYWYVRIRALFGHYIPAIEKEELYTARADDLCDLFRRHDLDISMQIYAWSCMYDLAHVAGRDP